MRLRVVAIDYDGTIATGGRAEASAMAAIAAARRKGTIVVLVTGRILDDLRCVGAELRAFDAVVAENGAVLAFPQSGAAQILASHVDADLVASLQAEGLRPSIGQCVIELPASAAAAALAAIRRLELPLVIHFNRDRAMVLPQAISKATGLRAALRALRVSPHNAMAIGDAENDHELLASCELGVAVAWGSGSLRRVADVVLPGSGPAAIAPYLEQAVAAPRLDLSKAHRRRLQLGSFGDGSMAHLYLRGRNILIAGDASSGKSWLAGLLVEQLILQGSSTCVIDPEGDHAAIAALPGVQFVVARPDWPTAAEITRLFGQPETSLVIDLSTLSKDQQRTSVQRILTALSATRRAAGLPQRVVIDEAHEFLGRSVAMPPFDDGLGGFLLVSYHISDLHADVLSGCEAVFVTKATAPDEVGILRTMCGSRDAPAQWTGLLASLALDEAAMLPGIEEALGMLRRFRLAPRMTHHVRHEHKYLDARLPDGSEFWFRLAPPLAHRCARSLRDFVEIVAATPTALLAEYLRRGDFSRWIAQVFRDQVLAGTVRGLEARFAAGQLGEANAAVVDAVHQRYHAPDEAVQPGPLA